MLGSFDQMKLLLSVAIALLAAFVHPSTAQQTAGGSTATGTVIGMVKDAETGEPLSPASILLLGTRIGAATLKDGRFTIKSVPAGRDTFEAVFQGYAPQQQVAEVQAGKTVFLEFTLRRTIVGTFVAPTAHGTRPVIDVKKTSTIHSFDSKEIEQMLTQSPTLEDIVEQQPGVVKERGKLHFRGGRADESLFVIDGVKVRDLLSGETAENAIAARSAQQVSVITGGFSARYSQAMSGVVETRIKEGSSHWHGALSYDSDILFDTQNLHQVYAELSGPNVPLASLLRLLGGNSPRVTFFSSLSADFTNTKRPSVKDVPGSSGLRSSVEDRFLGIRFHYGTDMYPCAQNRWRAIFKTAWHVSPSSKISLSWTKTISFSQDWGSPDIGQIDRNTDRYPWAWAKRMDHHYTVTKDVNIASISWEKTLGEKTMTALRLWRHYSGSHKDVRGMRWDDPDYDRLNDSQRSEIDSSFVDTPYFIDSGDAPDWRDRYVVVWGASNEWHYKAGAHDLQAGLSAEYHDVQFISINARNVSPATPLGDEFDLFHVTPNAGNLYVQDHFEYQGLVGKLGLVYDYWFPGAQIERVMKQEPSDEDNLPPHLTEELREKFFRETKSLFGHRFQQQLSPRLGISFPVSRRAHLFFDYGHYYQRPPYYYIYTKCASRSGENYPRIGNPTLKPKVSVTYEVGAGYQFTSSTALRATIFWKDLYNYPQTITLQLRERQGARSNFFMYWNKDYARSRGLEIELRRKRSNYLSGSISYSYSVAKGKSSDPNKTKLIQESGGDSRETSLGEEYLWWNRPHKLTARFTFLVRRDERPPRWFGIAWPKDFSFTIYYKIRSGRPYTPMTPDGLMAGEAYSANGPYDATCNISISKGFKTGRNRIRISLNVYNVFDYRTPLVFDWATGEPYEVGKGSLTDPRDDPSTYESRLEEDLNRRLSSYERWFRATYHRDPTPEETDKYAKEIAKGTAAATTAGYYSRSNPGYFASGRSFRLGVSYEW